MQLGRVPLLKPSRNEAFPFGLTNLRLDRVNRLRDALEAGLRDSELGAAISMGKRVVPIVPRDLDPRALPFDVRLRRYLIRETPEQTAEELSHTLQAA